MEGELDSCLGQWLIVQSDRPRTRPKLESPHPVTASVRTRKPNAEAVSWPVSVSTICKKIPTAMRGHLLGISIDLRLTNAHSVVTYAKSLIHAQQIGIVIGIGVVVGNGVLGESPVVEADTVIDEMHTPVTAGKERSSWVSAAETLGAGKVRSNGTRIVQFQAHPSSYEVRSPHVRTWRIPGAVPSPGLAAEVCGSPMASVLLKPSSIFLNESLLLPQKTPLFGKSMPRVVQSVHSGCNSRPPPRSRERWDILDKRNAGQTGACQCVAAARQQVRRCIAGTIEQGQFRLNEVTRLRIANHVPQSPSIHLQRIINPCFLKKRQREHRPAKLGLIVLRCNPSDGKLAMRRMIVLKAEAKLLQIVRALWRRAASRAALTAGNRSVTSIAIIAMTTRSSTSVNPRRFCMEPSPERFGIADTVALE